MIDSALPISALSTATRDKNPLWAKAKEMEANFLSEMLGYASVGKTSETFGGGIGEDQFASFLRAEQAKAIVQKGGIGLAESLFNAMTERANGG